jgi:hypothetical protein
LQGRLFEAAGIIESVRAALSNWLDEDAADNALRAAGRIVDDVAAELGADRGVRPAANSGHAEHAKEREAGT